MNGTHGTRPQVNKGRIIHTDRGLLQDVLAPDILPNFCHTTRLPGLLFPPI
jgi:hypothetical protein